MTGNTPYHNNSPQSVRRAIAKNDRRVHANRSTYGDHTHDDSGGRYLKQTPSTVIGSEPIAYPRLPENSWANQGAVVPPEPPLGVAIDQMEPTGEFYEVQASLRAAGMNNTEPSTDSPTSGDAAPFGMSFSDASSRRRRSLKRRKG
jgi:hypothetical protein